MPPFLSIRQEAVIFPECAQKTVFTAAAALADAEIGAFDTPCAVVKDGLLHHNVFFHHTAVLLVGFVMLIHFITRFIIRRPARK